MRPSITHRRLFFRVLHHAERLASGPPGVAVAVRHSQKRIPHYTRVRIRRESHGTVPQHSVLPRRCRGRLRMNGDLLWCLGSRRLGRVSQSQLPIMDWPYVLVVSLWPASRAWKMREIAPNPNTPVPSFHPGPVRFLLAEVWKELLFPRHQTLDKGSHWVDTFPGDVFPAFGLRRMSSRRHLVVRGERG